MLEYLELGKGQLNSMQGAPPSLFIPSVIISHHQAHIHELRLEQNCVPTFDIVLV